MRDTPTPTLDVIDATPLKTISEMCAEFGLSTRTLRYYGEIELLPPFRNGEHRLYDQAHKARLREILDLKRLGFALAEIHELLSLTDRGEHAERARRELIIARSTLAGLTRERQRLQEITPALAAWIAARAARATEADAQSLPDEHPAQERAA